VIAEAARQPEAADHLANGALSLEEMIECFGAVRDLTAPRGIVPLMERLAALFGADADGLSGGVQAMSSPSRPSNSSAADMTPPQ